MTIPPKDKPWQPPPGGFGSGFEGPSEWAAMYRFYRLQVIPSYRPGETASWKRPHLREWRTLQEALVPDATFYRWYGPDGEHVHRNNMGLLTGAASDGAFILDLDIHKNPDAWHWWNALLEEHNHGMQLETPTQVTGGGGLQLLFRAPPGWRSPTNKTPVGVDIRGEGGFAVLPPSRHESGKTYTWKPGLAPWEVPIIEAPRWLTEAIDALVAKHGGHQGNQPAPSHQQSPGEAPEGTFDAWGDRIEGREEYMRDMVWAALINMHRNGIDPTTPEAIENEWNTYELHAKPFVPGKKLLRDKALFESKWRYALKKWDTEIAEQAKLPPREQPIDPAATEAAVTKIVEQAKIEPAVVYEYLNVRQLKALPNQEWLIEGVIQKNTMGFIYGPPGSLKTFVALDMALSFACGKSHWWGRTVGHNDNRIVVYITSEGVNGFHHRISAWEHVNEMDANDSGFRLIRQPINFMQLADVQKLLATVQVIVDEAQLPVAAVFIDTVSRVIPGAEENQQKDMTIFVNACEAVKQRFNTVVVGLHHSNKEGGFRGSTVNLGAGDFILEVARDDRDETAPFNTPVTGKLIARKIKDADDNWTQEFDAVAVHFSAIVPTSSLVTVGGPPPGFEIEGDDEQPKTPPMVQQNKTPKGWPSETVLLEIRHAIQDQWNKRDPWSLYPNAKDRYAVTFLVGRWGLKEATAKEILDVWLARKIIVSEMYDAKSKQRGIRMATP